MLESINFELCQVSRIKSLGEEGQSIGEEISDDAERKTDSVEPVVTCWIRGQRRL